MLIVLPSSTHRRRAGILRAANAGSACPVTLLKTQSRNLKGYYRWTVRDGRDRPRNFMFRNPEINMSRRLYGTAVNVGAAIKTFSDIIRRLL